jgi:putative nucleotidyltransferase with HDIG domain
MSQYVNSVTQRLNTGALMTLSRSREKWTGLSDLSHYLMGSDTVDDLAESAAKYIVDILAIDYSRIILQDGDGQFYCKAAYTQKFPFKMHGSVKESFAASAVYSRLLSEDANAKLFLAHEHLSPVENASIGIKPGEQSWLIPLRADSQQIGILILGQSPGPGKELLDESSYYLVDLISDQLSGAFLRTQLNNRLETLSIETVIALSKTLETRDSPSATHSKHMANMSEKIASKYQFSVRETRELCWAALLHDIGKIGVEDMILKKPGPLDDNEWQVMRTHPEIGSQIVRGVTGLDTIAPLIFSHHERMDGNGYPRGLKGTEIPLGARIIAVVDSYSAMTEGRPYKKARSHQEALQELQKNSGQMYDPEVVDIFVGLFESESIEE